MIISHKHKFIFIKTNKTAGTSIEIALSKFCGKNDIITPISAEDELIRRELGYRGPQNYLSPFREYTIKDWIKLIIMRSRKINFYNHIPAREICKKIDKKVWDEYYKFCFERNPWDRIISMYYWRYKTEPRPTITEFLDSNIPMVLKRRGIELYTINGNIAVDKICRYEDINDELKAIYTKLGISEEVLLPMAKSGYRKEKKNYHKIYNVSDKQKVAELFCDEIALLGYKY